VRQARHLAEESHILIYQGCW